VDRGIPALAPCYDPELRHEVFSIAMIRVRGEHSVEIEALQNNAWLAIRTPMQRLESTALNRRALARETSRPLLTEAIHRGGSISKELRGSPKHCNLFRTEELSDHRNEERQKEAQLQGER
jgi:hypothetical protein